MGRTTKLLENSIEIIERDRFRSLPKLSFDVFQHIVLHFGRIDGLTSAQVSSYLIKVPVQMFLCVRVKLNHGLHSILRVSVPLLMLSQYWFIRDKYCSPRLVNW